MATDLHDIFLRSDVDKSFTLSREEYAAMLEDPEVQRILMGMGIHPNEVRSLQANTRFSAFFEIYKII